MEARLHYFKIDLLSACLAALDVNLLLPCKTIWHQRSESGSTLNQEMAACLMAPSLYLNRCWLTINEILWHSLNSLRPSDAIWRQWSWTTLAQVMACCLTAPSHYLNQCWLIIRGVLWHTAESIFAGIAQGIDSGYEFEKDILKNIFKSPRGQWVKGKGIANTQDISQWNVVKNCTFTIKYLSHRLMGQYVRKLSKWRFYM